MIKPPKKNSKRYKEIQKIGCGGYFDREDEFNCKHDYEWDCDYCPCFIPTIEKNNKTNEVIDLLKSIKLLKRIKL